MLSNSNTLRGVPPCRGYAWVDGVDGSGSGYGCVGGVLCMHTCSHMCMHAHTCTCMLNMINMDASMSVAICNFYTCIHVHACVCMHVHVCRDTPHAPRCPQTPPPTCPLPRAAGSPKHQISITLELIEIIQFCLKILHL